MKSLLQKSLDKGGISIEKRKLSKQIFLIAVVLNVILSIYIIYLFTTLEGAPVTYITFVIALVWAFIFFIVLFVLWLVFFLFIDLRIYKRKLSIEDVLPDYLQLTAANIRAGMTVDKALWYAVRPRFGVLSKEIETVAKETLSGKSLAVALHDFADKYDSSLLKRSVNLLIEGMESGGELGEILNKVTNNIQETRLLDREMSANVTTYIIFISAAVTFAAPLLLALSTQLLSIMSLITSSVQMPAATNTGMFAISSISIKPSEFKIFSMIMLGITAFFSAVIISIIKNGNVKSGLKYIPIFMLVSLIMFWASSYVLSGLFSAFFTI